MAEHDKMSMMCNCCMCFLAIVVACVLLWCTVIRPMPHHDNFILPAHIVKVGEHPFPDVQEP